MRRLDLAGDEVPSCVTPRHVAQLAEAEHDADEWQAALMLVAEHEPQRPRPPDLYIRGRAGRSSADLSAQPERYHIKLHFRPARKVPGYAKILAVILSGTGQTFVIWRVAQRGGNDALDQKGRGPDEVSEPLANT